MYPASPVQDYKRLVKWYNEEPSDLLIQRVKRHFASSETDIENMRQLLYYALKEFEEYLLLSKVL